MKVFISYSLDDAEQYVLSILAKRLKEKGYIVLTGYHIASPYNNDHNHSQINNSNLFIGIIASFGNTNNYVSQDWQFAKSRNIPSLLLIENAVSITHKQINDPNIIRFDRNNPEPSIELVKRKIEESRAPQQASSDSAWLIGGLAILALIALLSDDD